MSLDLKIITPDGIFFNGPVDSVNIKTTEGYLTLLQGHIPLIANIAIAPMMYRANGHEHHLDIAGGILITTLSEVRIISDTIQYIRNSNNKQEPSDLQIKQRAKSED